jgi:hypothetical protein
MAILPRAGNRYDFYTANDSVDFAIFPAGIIDYVAKDTPIRLQRGDGGFGAVHIAKSHGPWLDKHKVDVATMVWSKLQGSGKVYTTEESEKHKIDLRFNPQALAVLKYKCIRGQSPFFTVVTMYLPEGTLDGEVIGHYRGKGGGMPPVFALQEQIKPVVSYKTKRKLELPSD